MFGETPRFVFKGQGDPAGNLQSRSVSDAHHVFPAVRGSSFTPLARRLVATVFCKDYHDIQCIPLSMMEPVSAMNRESDRPQRIPKRQQKEGRVTQPIKSGAGAGNREQGIGNRGERTRGAMGVGVATTAKKAGAKKSLSQRAKPAPVAVAPVLNTKEEPSDQSLWQRFRTWMKATPALSFSLLLHIVAFAVLGAVTFATLQPKEELTITASAIEASDEPIEELAEIDMSELDEFEEESFTEDVAEMSDMVLEDVAVDAPIAEATPELSGTAPPVGTGAAESATKSAAKGGKRKGGKAASFYGAPAQGNRFAFIVDNSNSMVRGKMLTTMDQLMSTINGLTAKQEFYVIFYSDTSYPMFYPNSETDWVVASKVNKQKLNEWLQTVELCSGGRLDLALKKAFALEPDSIFLVGDGSDVGQAEQDVVTAQTKERRYVIHALCIGGDGSAAKRLASIAEYTGGTFRFVQPQPNFVQMSQDPRFQFKMNKSRGKVWGKNIGR